MRSSKFSKWVLCLITGILWTSTSFGFSVGVTAGPHAEIMEEVKKLLKNEGMELKIVEFNDFILPNLALEQKDLDLNSYQNPQFLEDQTAIRGHKFVNLGKTILLPLGVYSKKHKSLSNVPVGGKISIPNDPTNEGRALLLLAKAGLIELKTSAHPTTLDVSKNPKKIKIVTVEAPQLPRTLADVDAAVINTDWILVAKMDPAAAIFREGRDSPYANILVVRKGDEARPDVVKFKSIYQSESIRAFINKKYNGAILPAW